MWVGKERKKGLVQVEDEGLGREGREEGCEGLEKNAKGGVLCAKKGKRRLGRRGAMKGRGARMGGQKRLFTGWSRSIVTPVTGKLITLSFIYKLFLNKGSFWNILRGRFFLVNIAPARSANSSTWQLGVHLAIGVGKIVSIWPLGLAKQSAFGHWGWRNKLGRVDFAISLAK